MPFTEESKQMTLGCVSVHGPVEVVDGVAVVVVVDVVENLQL